MFSHADWLMGIIGGGRVRARLDVDRDGRSQRSGARSGRSVGQLGGGLEVGVVVVFERAASEALGLV